MLDLEELFQEETTIKGELNLSKVSMIQRRRRQLYVHSYLYYRMNTTLVPDETYDRWARELIELQKDYPRESETAPYHDDFKDFQMGDSFALDLDQAWIHDCCLQLLTYHKKKK
jgi:hypothetical protein